MITKDRAREAFDYDQLTGSLTWKIKPNRCIRIGQAAGTSYRGRITVGIDEKIYPIGRLIWLLQYGFWPNGVIDHINGNPLDNRIANLRDVPQRFNVENKRSATSRSKSRLLGVTWHSGNRKWRATITSYGKQKTLGYFDEKTDAHAAYVNAKRSIHAGNTI